MARARRNFWALAGVTTVAVGALSQALGRPAGPATAAMVAFSGLAALVSVTLAGRILVVTGRRGRHGLARKPARRTKDSGRFRRGHLD